MDYTLEKMMHNYFNTRYINYKEPGPNNKLITLHIFFTKS